MAESLAAGTTGTALVIGAGGGIGGACADRLSTDHAVTVCVDRDRDDVEVTAERVHARTGRQVEVVIADAAEETYVERVVNTLDDLPPVRTAVHAIAFEEHAAAVDLSTESFRHSLVVGPIAAFVLFRELVVRRYTTAGASLIGIGSLHERHAFRDTIGYNAAHAALGAVVRTLAHEWAGLGIRVNSVVPGWVASPGELAFYSTEVLASAGRALPFGRFVDPGEIADVVAFVASDQARHVSGASITVDGALGVSLAMLPGVTP